MKLLSTSIILLALFFFSPISDGQVLDFEGSRFQSLANSSVGLSGCWSVFGNQAGLTEIKRTEIAGSFQDRFLVPELSSRLGLIVFPIHNTVVAFSFYQFGENPFRQEKISMAFARRLFPQLSFGVQFNYYRLSIFEENRSAGSLGLELGIQYLLNKKLTAGFHVQNPYKTSIKTASASFDYPSLIQVGVWYRLSRALSLVSEIEHNTSALFRMKTGIEYNFQEKFYLRTGVSGNPYQLSAGIGFKVKNLIVDLGNSFHSSLGNSPSISFHYQF